MTKALVLLCLAIGSPLCSALKLHGLEADSEWSRTDHQHPPKNQLLFVHFEKSAGSYLGGVLKRVVGDANYVDYHNCGVPVTDVPNDYFVVASIRDPCSQAVSQWEYQCEKTYLLRVHNQPDGAANLQFAEEKGGCPTFNSTFNPVTWRWQAFPTDPNYAGFNWAGAGMGGLYQKQIMGNLQDMGLDRVNCWVRFENMQDSLDHCLHEFEKFTGTPINKAELERAREEQVQRAINEDSHHGRCEDFYPNTESGRQAESKVRSSNAVLFEYFDFSCCM